MTKLYKKGDVLRCLFGTFKGETITFLEDEIVGKPPLIKWSCLNNPNRLVSIWSRGNFELMSSTGFEVGKTYQLNDGWLKNIYTVEFVSPITGTALATTISGGKTISARLESWSRYKEIIPPPPEEWRAVYWVKNGKPEFSARYWDSKKAVEDDEKSHTHFMYAVRTDEGVLKSGN